MKVLARLRRKSAAVETLEQMGTFSQETAFDDEKKCSLVIAMERLLGCWHVWKREAKLRKGSRRRRSVLSHSWTAFTQICQACPPLSRYADNALKHKSPDIGVFDTRDFKTCFP